MKDYTKIIQPDGNVAVFGTAGGRTAYVLMKPDLDEELYEQAAADVQKTLATTENFAAVMKKMSSEWEAKTGTPFNATPPTIPWWRKTYGWWLGVWDALLGRSAP